MITFYFAALAAVCFIGYTLGRLHCGTLLAQLRDDLESRRQTVVDFSQQIDSQADAMTTQHERITILERENMQLKATGREVAKFANQQFPCDESTIGS